MKKFNLENIVVSKLCLSEINELVEYLTIVSVRECATFIAHVMDTEYILSDNSLHNGKVENFLANKKFNDFRELVINIDQISDTKWFELETDRRRKLRRKKLINIMTKK